MPGTDTFGNPLSIVNGKGNDGGRVYGFDRWLLHRFLNAIGDPALAVTLWDGREAARPDAQPTVGMVIRDRRTLLRLLTNPLLNFGDDYSAGRIEIEGGLVAFMETIYWALGRLHKKRPGSHRSGFWRNRTDMNSRSMAYRNIHQHYDIGNDFYRLWLDSEMLYTCGYFPDQAMSLEDAQIAKMDLVCRKLRLKPGQTVVEAGCGWGGLARYMARNYRVTVRAFNISHEQIVFAREKARSEGLEQLIEYVEDDYRSISGKYDVFVSVGMLEHVGIRHYGELGMVVDRSLAEQGIGLIHTIGQNVAQTMSPWLLKRIFPGSYPPTLREMMEIFEPWGFSVLDVENLRLHYVKTLEHWLERFEDNRELIAGMFDDCFVRAWRLYLSASIANFNLGNLQLFQVVFTRATNNRIPWTRSHLIRRTAET